MKKSRLIQYISLPLLATMYSCSDDVEMSDIPVIVPSANEITFSVGSVSDSRATILDNGNFVADGRTIGIYANKHKGNLSNSAFSANVMNNEELVYSNGIWSYSPMQFWSNSQDTLYSFVAYSPYHVNASIKDNNVVIPYDCAVKNNEQVDLLWGVTKNIYTPNNPVSLNFKHALSKVVFNVDGFVNGSDISNVKINNVIITGLANSADFSVNAYSNESSWGDYSNVANILVSNESLILTNSKSQIGEPLLLIPQELINAKLIVEYDIYSESVGDHDSKRVEFALSTAVTAAWSANKTYTYNLHLDLNAIEFSLSVHISDFETETEVDVELPNDGKAYTLMYYKSTDGQIVEPYNLDAFDAKLISNTYENGYGKMVFEGELTEIEDFAFNYCLGLTTVVIPEGVISIGYGAFYGCSSLTSIDIPESVPSIGYGAFYGCSALTSIDIPESVTSIGDGAFYGCSSLTSIDIPESVTSIGGEAFGFCLSLTSIEIPKGVISIGKRPFRHCNNITSIIVDRNNKFYDSRDNSNALIESSTNTLIAGCMNSIIPEGITSIDEQAFNDCSFSSIEIPASVISIKDWAFSGCSLTSIEIPASVTLIGEYAFYACSSLISITVDENNAFYDSRDNSNAIIESSTNTLIAGCMNTIIPESVTSIDACAFGFCSFTNIDIPESVISIGAGAFNASNLTSVKVLPLTPPTILYNPHGSLLFNSCDNLTTIQVPAESVELYKSADGWSEYADLIIGFDENIIEFEDQIVKSICIENWDTDNDGELSYSEAATIKTLSDVFSYNEEIETFNELQYFTGLASINSWAFYSCKELSQIALPSNVVSLGDYSFEGCINLDNIVLPETLETLGDNVFNFCDNLEEIEIPNTVKIIPERAFEYCYALKSITLYDGLTSIGNRAFCCCQELTSIDLPSTLESIGSEAFNTCTSLQQINVNAEIPPIIDVNGYWLSGAPLTTIQVPAESVELYKNADGWSEYADLIVGIE